MGDDIEIIDGMNDGRFTYVRSLINGDIKRIDRMPQSILSMHAAEYNLDPEDDFVLDLILLQRHLIFDDASQHPLWASDTLEEAVDAMKNLIEGVRVMHGSPEGENRMMAAAIRNNAASEGLVTSHGLLVSKIDTRVIDPIRAMTHSKRERHKKMRGTKKMDLAEMIHTQSLRAKVPTGQRVNG
jgi:hypothetical protein